MAPEFVGRRPHLTLLDVRYRKYSQIRKKLSKKLFLSKKSFLSTLLELNRLCVELRQTKFMQYNTKHTYTIDEFGQTQSQQRTIANKSFEDVIDKVQALLEKVCEDVTARVKPADGVPSVEEAEKNLSLKSIPVAFATHLM